MRAAARAPSILGQDVIGPLRLALLYLWHRDDRTPTLEGSDVVFHVVRGGPALHSPRMVDWSGFPWAEAFFAVIALR